MRWKQASAAASDDVRVVRRKWNKPQTIFRRIRGVPGGPLVYIDLEGAVGSGKTTAPAWRLVEYATDYPGIHMAICAWTDEMLGPPKNVFLAAAREAGFSIEAGNLKWHGGQGEEYYKFEGYDSRVYVRSMMANDKDMRIMKLAGLSLSVLWIDQPEPVPEDVFRAYVPARMRQPGYPHEVWFSPNPLEENHWISKEFPTDPALAKENHYYIPVALRDNIENVGAQFVADMELANPPGSVNYNLQVAGLRGPSLHGKPVYAGYFDRNIHVDSRVELDPAYPLLEGWDFGSEKPAVTFYQYIEHLGALRSLGSIKGEDLFLELFAPKVLEIRRRWFPDVPADVWSWCDPTGATGNGGLAHTPVRVLHDLGVPARFDTKANQLPVRYGAIQVLAGFMVRLARDGSPAFLMHPRCIELTKQGDRLIETETDLLVRAFQVGYVWSEHAAPDTNPNVRKPQKGTRYDDLMNAGEYIVIGENISVPQQAMLLNADLRLKLLKERQAEAVARREFDARQVGWKGETMAQAHERIARLNRLSADRDPADHQFGGAASDRAITTKAGGYYVRVAREQDPYGRGSRAGY